ncbi:hypothetical protein ACFWV1_18370 [Streptomyces sp. NPDC058700]|uniref:hypothetical protein n=1 Tax=Streptomyces sp. NPDC058700 TaxID=3346607 RepID=UPI00365552BE
MERFTSFDFGLSALTALFHQDWIHLGGVEEVVLAHLSVGEASIADEAQQKEAAALERDVAVLAGSTLRDGQIEVLFSTATAGNYSFQGGETGRSLLERIHSTCRQWQQEYGAIPAESSPKWSSSDSMAAVRSIIGDTPMCFPDEYLRCCGSPVDELRSALDACAQSASAELAFRLLLRIHLANFIPVAESSWARYRMTAAELSLGEELLSSLDFLVN